VDRRPSAAGLAPARLLALLLAAAAAASCATAPPAPVERSVRVLEGVPAPSPLRAGARRSLVYFGQLSDAHVTDAMSPLRLELLDPARTGDGRFGGSWRPQELMSVRLLDRAVRRLNERRESPTPQGDGRHASMDFVLVTGDLADNAQGNELRWAARVLAGGMVDPYSGLLAGPWTCPTLSGAARLRLGTRVATRAYSGVQRHDQYPAATPAARRAPFYDPEVGAGSEAHGKAGHEADGEEPPPHPGLLERALRPFPAEGLDVPYYVARGHHDGLVQGRYVISRLAEVFGFAEREIDVAGCRKAYPNRLLDPRRPPFDAGPWTGRRRIAGEARLLAMYEAWHGGDVAVPVPPDPRRRFVASPAYPAVFRDAAAGAGLQHVTPALRAASLGHAHYYAWRPRPGLRFVALDTTVQGDGAPEPDGNLDDPQFRWLAETLAATPSDELVVVFAHHDLASLVHPGPGRCAEPGAGCNADPRPAKPVHLGCPLRDGRADCRAPAAEGPPRTLRDLLLAHPNVVLLVNGHTHAHRIEPFARGDGGFWQVTTASLVDWPQHARTLELMDNGDGSLSILSDVLPLFDAPGPPWPERDAPELSDAEVAAVAHRLAASDRPWREGRGRRAAGRPGDANVELVLRDPRPR